MSRFLFILFTVTLIACDNHKPLIYNDLIPVHDSIDLASSILLENRRINVWTPPKYDTSLDSFAVLYMADGGVKEDFPHIANTLDTLIQQNKIKPVILVGIENTERRRDLTGPTQSQYDLKHIKNPGGSANFRKFIKEDLFPRINNQYRTLETKSIIGESLAGLFVVETMLLEPSMFDNYIAMDPSLWYNNQYLLRNFNELTNNDNYDGKKLWFAGSDAADINKATQALDRMFRSKPMLEWKYVDKPHEKHQTIFRASKVEALVWTLGMN